MPAQSKSQQRFFGVVKAMQKGDIPKKGKAGKIAKTMDKDDVDDFASTKHKGKPEKVKREQRVKNLIKKMVREELAKMNETTVRISSMKDVSFAGRDRLALLGKKGKVGLDRKSVGALAKAVRMILGRSFTTHEQKLNEAKTITLPNGVKAKIEFKGITLQAKGKKPVFLDRTEMMTFFKATQKYMKQGLAAGKMSEEKLTENKVYSKKDGLKIVKKLQAKDKKIYKVDKQKATYDGKKVLMYNLYTKDKAKYSGNNLHGLDMARNSKGEAMYLVPIKESSGKQIAQIILQQLGGNKFIAMTGAKNLGFTNKGLQMKIGRNSKGVTHVIIELDRGRDLYNIEFVKVRNFKRQTIKKLKGIYADQLGKIFTKYTGLRIRL